MEQMITDQSTVFYAIKINGQIVSAKYQTQMLAEMEKQKLPDDQRTLAEVVPVTVDGSQLLLG